MRRDSVIVLKFGGSVFAGPQSVPEAADEIYRWVRRGWKVVAAVSAMTGETDRLLRQAKSLSAEPHPQWLAQLASVGELESSALLGIALDRAGIPAEVLDAAGIGLRTRGPATDAEPVSVNEAAILAALDRAPVLVVPGFIGRDEHHRTTLLGRGGSDLTALFLAHSLHARCRLVKDVDGLYERDPKAEVGGNGAAHAPRRFSSVHWDDLAKIGGKVVQAKTAAFAAKHRVPFEIGGLLREDVTQVGDLPASFVPENTTLASSASRRPIRVTLLGYGVVGAGVAAAIERWDDHFTLVGIAVRDRAKALQSGADESLLVTDAHAALKSPSDVVIEVMGGLSPAAELIEQALVSGRHVVTANKAVIAAHGDRLDALASKHGVRLLRSASVGGGVPMLETIQRLVASNDIDSFEAVLNGTTNFVLGRVAEGIEFNAAVREAQIAGFAEADPSRDLDGRDAEDKLRLLIQAAFDVDHRTVEIRRSGLSPATISEARKNAGDSKPLRLVARACRHANGAIAASIGVEALDPTHALASVHREGNALVLTTKAGRSHEVRGKGAGRWPTTQAVFADLIELLGSDVPGPTVGTARPAVQRSNSPARVSEGARP